MNLVSIIAVYFVVWWIVLFAVLPWGMRTQEEEGEVVLGTDRSAPANPRLLRKAIITRCVFPPPHHTALACLVLSRKAGMGPASYLSADAAVALTGSFRSCGSAADCCSDWPVYKYALSRPCSTGA